jgi:hypothetical protein
VKSLDESFELVSRHVLEKCSRLGTNGVFVMCDLYTKNLCYACIDVDAPTHDNAPGERDLKYLGIAFDKIAFAAVSSCCPGVEPDYVHDGEVYWIGSVIEPSGKFAYAFSNTAKKIDREIASSALEFHATL